MQMMVQREPWVDSKNLDWAGYHRRLAALQEVAGPDWVPAKLKAPYGILHDPDPILRRLYNWAPFERAARKRLREQYGPEIFERTTREVIVLGEFEEGCYPFGDPWDTHRKTCTLPDKVEAFLTVYVPVADLGGWDIKRVMDPVEKLVREAIRECPTHEEAPGMLLAPEPLILPYPEGPAATFHIAVSGMRQEDVGRIMKEFKDGLHLALEDEDLRTEWVLSDRLNGFVPYQRRYLLHKGEETFQTDLKRYRLWMHGPGFTFRQIAFIEAHGGNPDLRKVEYTAGGEVIPRKVGDKPTEDAVGKSVARTYEAIYLEPFQEDQPDRSVKENARERRARLPRSLPEYDCPEHGTSCPPPRWDRDLKRMVGCPYLLGGRKSKRGKKGWRGWIDESILDLPQPWTGQFPRSMEFDEHYSPAPTREEAQGIGEATTPNVSPIFKVDMAEPVEHVPVAALPVGVPESSTEEPASRPARMSPRDLRELMRGPKRTRRC